MITGKTPYVSTVSLLSRPVNTAAAGAVSHPAGSEDDIRPVTESDKVQLSEAGIGLLPGETDKPDEARAARVQELKKAVEEKRYIVESRKVAAELLKEASELMATLTGFPIDPLEEARSEKEGTDEKASSASASSSSDTEDSNPIHSPGQS
ncbi:MAG: flagellar biosynthesis anti-sigma factor FlgM [Lautropia sp.]|nr:flagellar biosynthesis anti-sigma factor FlgM [Lautropia sp.]